MSASTAVPVCIHFSCCSPLVSASAAARHLCLLQLLLATCVCFSYCSPIASASAVAPRLRPPKFNCCSGFSCSSPIASALTAAHRYCIRQLFPASPCPMFLNILRGVRGSMVRRSRVTSLVPLHELPTSVTHTQTNTR